MVSKFEKSWQYPNTIKYYFAPISYYDKKIFLLLLDSEAFLLLVGTIFEMKVQSKVIFAVLLSAKLSVGENYEPMGTSNL